MFSNRKITLVIILLITLSLAAYVILVVIPTQLAERSYDGARRIGQDIREALQVTPTITVNNTVVLQQQTPVLELSTVSQSFRHEYEWINTWMGSTKKIEIAGTFEAKAGFNLQKKFQVDISEDKAIVTLPPPELLSLESNADITYRDENGIWNWVNQEDRTRATNAFITDARRYAQSSDIPSMAREHLEKQLTQIFSTHGLPVEFRYGPDATLAPL